MRGARLGAAFAAAALACLMPVPAAAQEPLEIEPGQTVTGKAGKPDTPDLYYFVGESGATVTFEVEAPGPVSVALLTSDGDTMLEASGTGSARLEAVLSLTDVFYVAVLRQETGAPYVIEMDAQEPDFHLALFSRLVGYGAVGTSSSGQVFDQKACWVEPGTVYKSQIGAFVMYHELLRGGRQRGYLQYPGVPDAEVRLSWDGKTIERTIKMNGETSTASEPIDDQTFARPDVPGFGYTGYMCD
jgi:hypothetical protein